MKTCHRIEVANSADEAYEMCLDVTSWPEVFPPCLDAVVLAETDTRQDIALTARANGEVFRWNSSRKLDRAARAIEFVQVKTSPLVSEMAGTWSVLPAGSGCTVAISHNFEIKDEVAGLVPGVNTRAEAERFMCETIEANSRQELAAIKRRLEGALWRHEFSESKVVDHSRAAIFKLLRDAEHWPWLLPHCNAVEMIYQDPEHQEFVMKVQVGEEEETIRSIRILRGDQIEYFQPSPPPALTEHMGRWSLRETDAGVAVTSWHAVVLNPSFWAGTDAAEAKRKVEAAINRNSMGTINAIVTKLGENYDALA